MVSNQMGDPLAIEKFVAVIRNEPARNQRSAVARVSPTEQAEVGEIGVLAKPKA